MSDPSDDLDWLYRRGRYSNDAPLDSDRTRVHSLDRITPRADDSSRRPEPARARRAATPSATRPVAPDPAPKRVKPPKKRNWKRRLVIAIALLLAYVIGVPAVAWSSVNKTDAMPSGARPGFQPGHLYVLAGSDARDTLTDEERRRLGTGATEGRRTDTIMLLYAPAFGKPALISVPRDSYVEIPGHGKNKINASYSIGGPELLVQTIEHNTGLRVDGYIEVGFGGFVEIVDAVGGIEMCLDKPIKDRDSHLDLPAGCQHFDGVTALGYVRMRKADPRGDLGRVDRQRQMIAAVVKKAATPMSVINPMRYYALNKAGAGALTTGNGTGMFDVGIAGMSFIRVARGDGYTLTVPVSNANASTSAGSAVIWDEGEARDMFRSMAGGSTKNFDKYVKK